MILVDYNQVFISNAVMSAKAVGSEHISPNFLRHMILNTIRAIKTRFKNDYGQLVIACDSPISWRKTYFPHYKENRKKIKEDSFLDWKSIHRCMNEFRIDLKENFSYPVIQVEGAEADDIIATIISEITKEDEKVIIISRDHDFVQLQKYDGVHQHDWIQNKYIVSKDPIGDLFKHIVSGDVGDGIPNILSDEDTFVVKEKRQKPLTKKKIETLIKEKIPPENSLRFLRNRELIDLSLTPLEIKNKIMQEFYLEKDKENKNVLRYLMVHNLKYLTEKLSEF